MQNSDRRALEERIARAIGREIVTPANADSAMPAMSPGSCVITPEEGRGSPTVCPRWADDAGDAVALMDLLRQEGFAFTLESDGPWWQVTVERSEDESWTNGDGDESFALAVARAVENAIVVVRE